MSKDLVSGRPAPDIREKDKILLRCFSDYEEYLEYLRDFYCEDWCSLTWQDVSEEQKALEIDLAYVFYYDGRAVSDFDYSDYDPEEDEGLVEEVYVKDRSSRALNRKRAWLAREHNLKVGVTLSKKSLKLLSEEEHTHRPSATFYKREKARLALDEDEYQAEILTHSYRTRKRFYAKSSNWFKHHTHSHDGCRNSSSAAENEPAKAESAEVNAESATTGTNASRTNTPYFNREVKPAVVPGTFRNHAKVTQPTVRFVSGLNPDIMPFYSRHRSFLGIL